MTDSAAAIDQAIKPRAALKGGANCRIFTSEGTNNALELLLSFVGASGKEVGTALDLSKFSSTPWKAASAVGPQEELGVVFEGTMAQETTEPWQPV